ncbi:Reticulon-domain-containing protein [Elsinoe ampelina]|uniref:Reticulon-like protein n=1 Tax=Elsinoe ampelina TaxID=302913 RepID=A0A6A6GP07_9PEZI|nr:Reticulon-domain-containing protein [Elsinoe ampelina]
MSDPTAQASYPNINPSANNLNGNTVSGGNLNGSAAGLKDSIISSTQSAYDSVANSNTAQNISQGPVAQKAREEANKTSNEFGNVAASRRVPDQKTATGQPLTHYHSMFYNILSWENPRVTGIAYATIVTFIFFTRYVPILKYFFKASYVILGIIAAAEIAGKVIFEKGLASQMRPRKYYTIPRESLEAALEDVEQLINFFVIEFQRIVFAENVYATVSAFSAALISYFLVKFVPKWGIALIGTSVVFFVPLVYIQNRELIDGHLNNASTMINQQATQVRDLAAQHTGRAGEVAKSTVSQYTAQVQDLIGQAKNKTSGTTSGTTSTQPTASQPISNGVKKEDFPTAPRAEPITSSEVPSDPIPQSIPAQ